MVMPRTGRSSSTPHHRRETDSAQTESFLISFKGIKGTKQSSFSGAHANISTDKDFRDMKVCGGGGVGGLI